MPREIRQNCGAFSVYWPGGAHLGFCRGDAITRQQSSIHRPWPDFEAARSLGMSYSQTMGSSLLPQAARRMLPPLGGKAIPCC